MTVSLSSPWPAFFAGMLLPSYIIFVLAKQKLRKCAPEFRSSKGSAVPLVVLRELRWHLLAGVLALGAAWALVVAPHRLFLSITSDETGLTLDYPWPRSDVHLAWGDVSQATVATRKFGVLKTTRFCLRVEAVDASFQSPWSATSGEVIQARDLIEARLGQRAAPSERAEH